MRHISSKSLRAGLAITAASSLLIFAGCGGGGGDGLGKSSDSSSSSGSSTAASAPPSVVEVKPSATAGTFDATEIYAREAPGVVTVRSLFGDSGGGVGSGFVINGNGEIATNAHVVTNTENGNEKASSVYVQFGDSNQVKAEVVGIDLNSDIALLKVDPKGLKLHVLPLGTSRDIKVGAPVAAIGSPFGEPQSLSVGIVSAVGRSVKSLTNFDVSGAIQTDAAINPGNSGGPLVDAAGKVIGVNQQIASTSGGGEGVGFALPIDVVKRSLDQLRSNGKAEYGFLGVSSSSVYPQLNQEFKLGTDSGAWIGEVNPGTPAADAGLKGGSGSTEFQGREYPTGGDVIVKLNDTPITDAEDLGLVISEYKPGDKVKVQVKRSNETKTVTVTLGSRPSSPVQTG